jgi:hypothetical protein
MVDMAASQTYSCKDIVLYALTTEEQSIDTLHQEWKMYADWK